MIDFFIRIYSSIHNSNPFLAKVKYYGTQRFIIRILTNFLVPLSFKLSTKKSHSLNKENKEELIVSLTTFPARINKIWIIIECLMRQTYKPDKIILWLSIEQFKSLEALPKRLLKLIDRGLEIEICEGDLRSHKKYFYTLNRYPTSKIITVDDDFFYPSNLIEELMAEHKKNPNDICCHRAHRMTTENGQVLSYKYWEYEIEQQRRANDVFFTSGGGTLFPVASLHEEATKKTVFMDICRLADDVWLNAMCRLQETKVNKLASKHAMHIPLSISQNVSLSSVNSDENQNDVQIEAVRKHYLAALNKDIFENIDQ